MSDDNTIQETPAETIQSDVVDTTIDNQDIPTETSESDAESKVKQLMAELDKANQVLEKARKGEKYAKSQKDRAIEIAKAELDAKYAEELTQLKTKLTQFETEKKQAVLTKSLTDVGAIDVKAVSKLIGDVSAEEADKAIKQAMVDYPALFAQKQTPATPNRSTDGLPTSNLEAELAEARKAPNVRSAVNAVYAKYGIAVR